MRGLLFQAVPKAATSTEEEELGEKVGKVPAGNIEDEMFVTAYLCIMRGVV